MPKSNSEFWQNKIKNNIERDTRNYETLRAGGWNVIVVWECQLKKDVFENTMHELEDQIRGLSL